jgi:hypothetical protein
VLLESAAVERGMAKLFRGKVQPFGSSGLRFTQSALLAAVAIVGLKSLVEFIRLQTLGKAGKLALIEAWEQLHTMCLVAWLWSAPICICTQERALQL